MHSNFLLSMLVLFTMVFIVCRINMIRNDFVLGACHLGAWEASYECRESNRATLDGVDGVCDYHGRECPHFITDVEFKLREDALGRCRDNYWHKMLGSVMEWDTWLQ